MLTHLLVHSLTVSALTAASPMQDPSEIMAEMQRRQEERYGQVDSYLKVESNGTIRYATYHEKVDVDGKTTFRVVPFDEITARMEVEQDSLRLESAKGMASAYDRLQDYITQQAQRGAGRMMSREQLASPMASFMGRTWDIDDPNAEAAAEAEAMADFIERARVVGTEEVDGHQALHLQATDLDDIELPDQDDSDVTLTSMSYWIDAEEYVPLRMTIELMSKQDDQEIPFTLEKLDEDYRHVGPLYEPYRTITRITGLREALSAQFAEMEKRLAELPPNTRAMIQSQMQNMMGMSSFESMVEVIDIQVNSEVPDPETMRKLLGGPGER